jgi:hypothetical protein
MNVTARSESLWSLWKKCEWKSMWDALACCSILGEFFFVVQLALTTKSLSPFYNHLNSIQSCSLKSSPMY